MSARWSVRFRFAEDRPPDAQLAFVISMLSHRSLNSRLEG